MGSHPVIRYAQIPVVKGPIFDLNRTRSEILNGTVQRTLNELAGTSSEALLEETLFDERVRLKHAKPNWFTRRRYCRDKILWKRMRRHLLQPNGVSPEKVLEQALRHYADEIGGHFNPGVYGLATRIVPFGLSWLLNAASMRRFLPWGTTESLQSRLQIVGAVPELQEAAKRGTVLLVPTHQSNIDSLVVAYAIYLMSLPPFAYGAGLNLFSSPILSFFMNGLGAYRVDRQKSSSIYKRLLKNYSVDITKRGIHSVFFPGGGRSRSGEIEDKVKLGLLGTGLQAEIENLMEGRSRPRVFIVPMVLSYDFVLEAPSLIEQHLTEIGKHRFIERQEESWDPIRVFRFFRKLFSQQSSITVRIGTPLTVLGELWDPSENDEDSLKREIARFTVDGALSPQVDRDHELVRLLGDKIVERYRCENTVMTSHVTAFALFESLKKKNPALDLFRLIRLPKDLRRVNCADFIAECGRIFEQLSVLERSGKVHLSDDFKERSVSEWVRDGIANLGQVHSCSVIETNGESAWTDDTSLLYYYRNRLEGYGLGFSTLSTEQNRASLAP